MGAMPQSLSFSAVCLCLNICLSLTLSVKICTVTCLRCGLSRTEEETNIRPWQLNTRVDSTRPAEHRKQTTKKRRHLTRVAYPENHFLYENVGSWLLAMC